MIFGFTFLEYEVPIKDIKHPLSDGSCQVVLNINNSLRYLHTNRPIHLIFYKSFLHYFSAQVNVSFFEVVYVVGKVYLLFLPIVI